MSTIKPRSASVVIYQGDDFPVMAELRQAADTADRFATEASREVDRLAEAFRRSQSGGRLGDADESLAEALSSAREVLAEKRAAAQEKRDAYDAFIPEAAERAVEVVLQAIGNRRFRQLLLQHPPRKVPGPENEQVVHEDDAEFDVNSATFPDALLRFADEDDPDRRTIAAPEFTHKALAEFLDDEIEFGNFERLWQTAYALNRGASIDPFLTTFSDVSPRSEPTSTSAPRLG